MGWFSLKLWEVLSLFSHVSLRHNTSISLSFKRMFTWSTLLLLGVIKPWIFKWAIFKPFLNWTFKINKTITERKFLITYFVETISTEPITLFNIIDINTFYMVIKSVVFTGYISVIFNNFLCTLSTTVMSSHIAYIYIFKVQVFKTVVVINLKKELTFNASCRVPFFSRWNPSDARWSLVILGNTLLQESRIIFLDPCISTRSFTNVLCSYRWTNNVDVGASFPYDKSKFTELI